MSPSRFATLDKCIKTNVPELERNQLGSNFEIFDHQFTDVSLVSLHSLPRPDALHDRDVPPATCLCHALNPCPHEDDLLFSTRLFNPTPHSSVMSPRRSRHEEAVSSLLQRLRPVLWRRAHPRPDLTRHEGHAAIIFNMCFTLKPDSALPITDSVINITTPTTTKATTRRTSMTPSTPPSSSATTSCARGRSSPSSSRSTSSWTLTTRRSAPNAKRPE